jgi:hypothetical protein
MEIIRNQDSRLPIDPLAVDETHLVALLGGYKLSTVTLWRLEKRGLLKRLPGVRRRLYTMASVRAFVAGRTEARSICPTSKVQDFLRHIASCEKQVIKELFE